MDILVLGFLAASLGLYAVTGGADFGVGIVESVTARNWRPQVRALGEKSIAPIWEANHIWLILALVILFVGFPSLHTAMATHLHLPLVLMLVGVILRGTAFTFRYYDVDPDPAVTRVWSLLFRAGSWLVPMAFGILLVAPGTGRIHPSSETVLSQWFSGWLAPFPLLSGVFATTLFGWLAACFLTGSATGELRAVLRTATRRWAAAMVIAGALVTTVAWTTSVATAEISIGTVWPVVMGTVATVALAVSLFGERLGIWTTRVSAGAVVLAVVFGYFLGAWPVAWIWSDGTVWTWHGSMAPPATLRALGWTLIGGSIAILPGLIFLYRLFVTRDIPEH